MDNRKYFDYKLAYDGYKKALDLFNRGGIQAILDDGDYEISCGGSIDDWACNGYVPLYASGYNANIYLSDKNFDTGKKPDWYVSSEVDIFSYSGGDDNLFITNIDTLLILIIYI